MTGHSPVGASVASRFMNCPGSVQLSQGIEDEQSEYALEGQRAHELCEAVLLNDIDTLADLVSQEAYTQEMLTYAERFAVSVRSRLSSTATLLVEQKVQGSHPQMFGTADALIFDGDTLHVIDYKYGKGVPVEVRGNVQLRYYAACALHTFPEQAKNVERIVLTIFQPRGKQLHEIESEYDGASEEITRADVEQFNEKIAEAIALTETDNAPLVKGEWCRFCKAKMGCPAYNQAPLVFLEGSERQLPVPSTLDDATLADIIQKQKSVQEWFRRCVGEATARLKQGTVMEGLSLSESYGNRKWVNECQAREELLKLFGEAVLAPPVLLSPAKLEKVIGPEAIGPYVTRDYKGETLAVGKSHKKQVKTLATDVFIDQIGDRTK